MTDDRDPGLQALFDAAPVASASDAFVRQVMADIDRVRRRTLFGWALAGLVLLPITWWLSGPVTSAVALVGKLMPDTLISIDDVWLEQLFAPVNSVTGVVGLLFLVGWVFYRKISR